MAFGRFDPDKPYPKSVHPVITKHPVTGKKVIFVNKSFTAHINELPADESDAVLRFLYGHIMQPLWAVRFTWRKDSIAFWDNRCTQHYAVWDYYPQTRVGNRVQIESDRPPIAA
jgi:taurine dioxygenase